MMEHATPSEIQLAVDVEKEKLMDLYKTMTWIGYNCAALIGVAINNPQKFPTLEEAFPTLFETTIQQDWWIMKERVEKFAAKKGSSS